MSRSIENTDEKFIKLVTLASAGDLPGVRSLVAAGFDPTTRRVDGTPLLEELIGDLWYLPAIPKYEVVKTMLELGADASQRSPDGTGPLYLAVMDMDTEMLRLLIDAGADPNDERMDSAFESLYDWAVLDYELDVWSLDEFGSPADTDLVDEDSWLRFLDREAIQRGRRRPDHLVLLRERGALSMAEMSELQGSPRFGVLDKLRNRFDICIEVIEETDAFEGASTCVCTTISIDGEAIEPQHYVDAMALVESLRSSGRYEIFVCGCTKPRACGAVFHGVEVRHGVGGIVRWDLRRPQLVYPEGEPSDGPLGPEVKSTYSFRRSQMIAALESYFDSLRAFAAKQPNRVEWPIYGQSLDHVLGLELPDQSGSVENSPQR